MKLDNDVRTLFENELTLIREKISLREDNVKGSLWAFGVGFSGFTYGVLTGTNEAVISGMIVSAGSLLYRCFNNDKLVQLKDDETSVLEILDEADVYETLKKLKK